MDLKGKAGAKQKFASISKVKGPKGGKFIFSTYKTKVQPDQITQIGNMRIRSDQLNDPIISEMQPILNALMKEGLEQKKEEVEEDEASWEDISMSECLIEEDEPNERGEEEVVKEEKVKLTSKSSPEEIEEAKQNAAKNYNFTAPSMTKRSYFCLPSVTESHTPGKGYKGFFGHNRYVDLTEMSYSQMESDTSHDIEVDEGKLLIARQPVHFVGQTYSLIIGQKNKLIFKYKSVKVQI